MSDIVERKWVNGREFVLTLREIDYDGRSRWVGWVSVTGKEDQRGSSASFTGLSDGDVREQAERWMLKWRN